MQHRAVRVDRAAVSQESRTVSLAFSSEEPYERYWGVEILDHSPGAMRMGRLADGAPLLCNHRPDEQIGVVEQATIGTDRIGRASCKISRNPEGEEALVDIVDGIKSKISVGYVIHAMQLVEEREGVPVYRVTDWEPYEISLVSIPADNTVGIGRSAETTEFPLHVTKDDSMTTETNLPAAAASAPAATAVVEDQAAKRAAEIKEIAAVGAQYAKHGGERIALEAMRDGKSLKWVHERVLDAMSTGASPASVDLGMSKKEVQRYSLMKAIYACANRDWSKAGFEREAHEALIAKHGDPKQGGFFVPYEIQRSMVTKSGERVLEQRDLSVGTSSAGGYLVGTDHLASSFIELLRNRSRVVEAGARMLPGLVGNVSIPRQTAAATAYWLSTEGGSITESQQTFGQLSLTPKTVGAYTELGRQLMMQSSPAADALVMDDLGRVVALAIDLAALNGSGSSGEPTGILNTSGIGSVTGSSLAVAGVIEFQSDVGTANALTPTCSYMTTPAVAGLLMARSRFSNTDTPLWNGGLLDAQMMGFPARATAQMPSATMVFGDFSQVIIGEWGVLEIAVNPFADFQSAKTGIRAIQTCDVGVRYAAAFSAASSIT